MNRRGGACYSYRRDDAVLRIKTKCENHYLPFYNEFDGR